LVHAKYFLGPDQAENVDLTRERAFSRALLMSGPQRFGPQSGETGAAAQPPLPSGLVWRGWHGSQQAQVIGHPRLLSAPTEHVSPGPQQVGKQYSVPVVQYFQRDSLT
jgi:hypothetical protein